MDLSRGCILVARSLDESDIFKNEKWLKVWIWCLIQANHKKKNVPVNTGRSVTVVKVKRGQFIFGRHTAAKKLKPMKPSTIWFIMQKLDKLGNLELKTNSHYTLVTITDYDFYQNMKIYVDRHVDRQLTGNRQPTDTTNTPKQPNTPNTKTIVEKPKSVNDQTWEDFLKHRKNRKAIVTENVIEGFQKQAGLCGYSLEDAFKESINRGWTGFKAEWINKDLKNKQNSDDNYFDGIEMYENKFD